MKKLILALLLLAVGVYPAAAQTKDSFAHSIALMDIAGTICGMAQEERQAVMNAIRTMSLVIGWEMDELRVMADQVYTPWQKKVFSQWNIYSRVPSVAMAAQSLCVTAYDLVGSARTLELARQGLRN